MRLAVGRGVLVERVLEGGASDHLELLLCDLVVAVVSWQPALVLDLETDLEARRLVELGPLAVL